MPPGLKLFSKILFPWFSKIGLPANPFFIASLTALGFAPAAFESIKASATAPIVIPTIASVSYKHLTLPTNREV